MELKHAIERAMDGYAVLFIGAGFSRGAINIRGYSLPLGHELAARFAKLCGLPEATSLEDATEAYTEKYNDDELIREIQNEYTVKEVKTFHRDIAALPWKRIYTTNYDNVMETAYRLEGRLLTPVTADADIYKLPKTDTLCIHLNGYVERLDRSKIRTELKLTETSYLTASLVDSPWSMLFRDDLRIAQSVFFLGYSLYDLDIKRLLLETSDLKNKTFFLIGETPDDVTARRASRFGIALNRSVESFSSIVEEVKKNYVPKERHEILLLAIKEYSASTVATQIADKDFLDLLLLGYRNQNLISESLRTGHQYFLERTSTNDVFNLINMGHRVIVVCSDLGNGKSLFLEGLRLRASEKGFRVFDVRERGDVTFSELEQIAKLQQKTLTIIEEYHNWLDEIRFFRLNASPDAVLVLTARNAINDVVIDDLPSVAGVQRSIPEINMDELQGKEIAWFIETLDIYGLWGTRASLSRAAKMRFIENDCQSQIHAILLKLLSSPQIGHRIQKIAKNLKDDTSNCKVLLSVLVLTLLNYNATLDMLADIWGVEAVSSTQFRTSTAVKQFVDVGTRGVLVRSAVAAEYILHETFTADIIVEVLLKIFDRVHKGSQVSPAYYDIFKSLMKFSSLQVILPEGNRRNAVIHYYESIKNFDKCRNNPQFWLQYAIASLVIGDLKRSKLYFDTAYSFAKRLGSYNTYRIDNHYARFLLVQAVQELEHEAAMQNFREARTIIKRQVRGARIHYPYRVAITFRDFLDRFSATLTTEELNEVVSAANEILERIAQMPEERRHHRYVNECSDAMNYVVTQGMTIALRGGR